MIESSEFSPRGRNRGIPWARLLGEAVVIIASVYVAIVLEGLSQERSEARAARQGLEQVLAELREDQSDLMEIRAEQEALDVVYANLVRWLEDPAAIPGDSVGENLFALGWSNRTLFPRQSAWRTMIAHGQLAALDAPELVTRLGNLYENVNRRLEYNGEMYDQAVNRLANEAAPEFWNPEKRQPFDPRPEVTARFRSALRQTHLAWNAFYLDLLDGYQELAESLTREIEAYLTDHGVDPSP